MFKLDGWNYTHKAISSWSCHPRISWEYHYKQITKVDLDPIKIFYYGPKMSELKLGLVGLTIARVGLDGTYGTCAMFLIQTRPAPKLVKPKLWSREFNHWIRSALNKVPDLRPTSSELLFHPFMQNVGVSTKSSFARFIKQLKRVKKQSEDKHYAD